ncbi:MAG: phosphotransferase [Pseudomonadota bacterium]
MREQLSPADLRFTPPELPTDVVLNVVAEHWGLTGEPEHLSGERDQNLRLLIADGTSYVVKVASPVEDPIFADYQTRAMQHVAETDAGIPIPRVIPSKTGHTSHLLEHEDGKHIVRVLSWVDGAPLGSFPPPPTETAAAIGRLQGRLCKALSDFSHPAATHFMPWDILNGLVESEQLAGFLGPQAAACTETLTRLRDTSLPRMREFPHQVIHNDAHGFNVMCDPDNPSRITGLIDFGDLAYRPLVVDLAVSLTSLLERSPAPYDNAAAVVSNFQAEFPIDRGQLELLLDAILARAILVVQLLEFRAEFVTDDAELRDEDIPQCRDGLDRILALEQREFLEAVTRNE